MFELELIWIVEVGQITSSSGPWMVKVDNKLGDRHQLGQVHEAHLNRESLQWTSDGQYTM